MTDIAKNVSYIIAIEWLEAAQGLDFRRPLKASAAVETAFNCLREQVAYYDQDRYFAPDIKAASDLIQKGELAAVVKLPHILS